MRCEGVNVFLADGEAAFQEVFHLHLHVFRRFAGDGFQLNADWRMRDRATLDTAAGAVRAGLARLDAELRAPGDEASGGSPP